MINKSKLPTLNLNQLYLILSSLYFDIERSDNELFILEQLESAEWIEEEIAKRKT